MSDVMEKFLDKLYKTKAARFNADGRLRLQHKLANYTIMLLSIYGVVLSLSDKYLTQPLPYSDLISLALSVFLIGIAGFEAGNDRLQRAYVLHKNALEINALLDKSKISKNLEQSNEEYHRILRECEFNHENIDYDFHLMWNTSVDPLNRVLAALRWLISLVMYFGIYVLLAILPLIYFSLTYQSKGP